jgi:hypothetical protein
MASMKCYLLFALGIANAATNCPHRSGQFQAVLSLFANYFRIVLIVFFDPNTPRTSHTVSLQGSCLFFQKYVLFTFSPATSCAK